MAPDFIYRMPLVDFDIYDENQIEEHFADILERIRISSEALYQALRGKRYGELSPHQKRKVFKYLNRGKYRAVPFGKWTAIGTANIGRPIAFSQSNLQYKQPGIADPDWFCTSKILEEGICTGYSCRLAAGMKRIADHFLYRSFVWGEQRWVRAKVKSNGFLDSVYSGLSRGREIRFENFLAARDGGPESEEQWIKLIRGGFLSISAIDQSKMLEILGKEIPGRIGNCFSPQVLLLPPGTREKLAVVAEEMGNLFERRQSAVLLEVSRKFIRKFDDRFVPLEWLLDFGFGLEECLEPRIIPKNENVMGIMISPVEEVDLRDRVSRRRFEHFNFLSLAFGMGPNGRVVIRNAVCERPLAYCGRMADHPNINNYIQCNILPHYDDPNVEYVEVGIRERPETQVISQSKTLFKRVLGLCEDGRHSGEKLGVQDLYVGISQQEWILVEKCSQKRIIPVFPHAISYQWISHPLARLLWEIAHQGSYKPRFLQDLSDLDADYLPRVCWGSLILCGRRWKVKLGDMGNMQDLGLLLGEKNIPNMICVGKDDVVLTLDRREPISMEVIWDELCKKKEIYLTEFLGSNSNFEFQNGAPSFPEFIWNLANPEKKKLIQPQQPVNIVDQVDRSWISYHIYGQPTMVRLALVSGISDFLEAVGDLDRSISWFYVAYEDEEKYLKIRIRAGNDAEIIENLLHRCFARGGVPVRLEASDYYPETTKYGNGGRKVSEEIFELESVYFVEGTQEWTTESRCILELPEEMKQRLAVSVWSEVLLGLGLGDRFTSAFEAVYRDWDRGQRQKASKSWQKAVGHGDDWNEMGLGLSKKFRALFSGHELFDRLGIDLVLRHIHMFCNRLFLWDCNEHERFVLYGIYRIHKKSQIMTRQLH